MEQLLIVALGNPGLEYAETRHNVGFRLADDLASFRRIPLTDTSRHAVFGQGQWKGKRLIIAKPMTYMNRSGLAVAELMERLSCPTESLIVVCDDVNLPLGQIRLRKRGSHGGQKGLKSIIEHLETGDFARLRLGIGMPSEGVPLEDYVLDAFYGDEEEDVERMVKSARDAILCIMHSDIDIAMSRCNRRVKPGTNEVIDNN